MSAGEQSFPPEGRRSSRLVAPLLLLLVTAALFAANLHATRGAPFPYQYLGYLNWDAQSWLETVDNFPQSLLHSIWVDRPLYPALIAAAKPLFHGNAIRAFRLVNYALYLGCCLLFLAANRRMGYSQPANVGAVVLFAAGALPLTWLSQALPQLVDYFWVAFLYFLLACRYHAPERWTWLRTAGASLALGLFLLAKTYFVIYPLFTLLAIQQRRLRELPLFYALSVLPYAAWYLTVTRYYGCRFYCHNIESQFQHITWIVTALKAHDYGLLGRTMLTTAQNMVSSIGALWTMPLILVGLVALWCWPRRFQEPILRGSPRVFAIVLVSLWIMGYATAAYMPPRLMIYIFPILYPPVASVLWQGLDERWPRAGRALYVVILAGYALLSTLTLSQYVLLCC